MKTKTIEERAKDWYSNHGFTKLSFENYIKIATEQHEIDIQRACEWLLLNTNNTTASWEDGVKEEKLVEEFKNYMLSENEL